MFFKTLIYNLSTLPCHGQSGNTAVTGNNKVAPDKPLVKGKKLELKPQKKKRRAEGRGREAQQQDTAADLKNTLSLRSNGVF